MNNWITRQISECADVMSGGTPSRAVADYWGSDYFWVTPTDITGTKGSYLYESKEKISEIGLKNSSAKLLPPGAILMTSRATLGESKISKVPVCTNQGFKSLVVKDNVSNVFLRYSLLQNKSRYSSFGIGTTFLEVNKADTDRFQIYMPELKSEQEKIAAILMAIDEQIESTDKLIDKKKDIKKGLVQDLIYTKIHDKPIENVVDILDNLRVPINDEERQRLGGNVPYYGANGLQGFIDRPLFNEPLILMAEDGGNFEQFASRPIAYRISGPSWVNNHAHILRAKNYNQDYLFYVLEHMNILSFISGGTRAKLNQGELRKIKVPSTDIKEQERISKLINLVVDEINDVSMLKAKLTTQKQGLMQDLLTGRVRVKDV